MGREYINTDIADDEDQTSFNPFNADPRASFNSLPEHITTTVKVKTFESRLDTYWKDYTMKLDFTIEYGQHTIRVPGKVDTTVEETIEMTIEKQQLILMARCNRLRLTKIASLSAKGRWHLSAKGRWHLSA